MTTATRMSAEEYFAVSVEGDHKQLVDGQIVVTEAQPMHGSLQATLIGGLWARANAGEGRGLVLSPTDVTIDDFNVYGPDLLWIAERHRPADLRRRLERVPDLCVEIRSPGTWRYDVGAKKAGYERAGLPELWLVDDVSQTLLAFRRSEPDAPSFDVALELTRNDTLSSPQVPGFALSLAELFATAR